MPAPYHPPVPHQSDIPKEPRGPGAQHSPPVNVGRFTDHPQTRYARPGKIAPPGWDLRFSTLWKDPGRFAYLQLPLPDQQWAQYYTDRDISSSIVLCRCRRSPSSRSWRPSPPPPTPATTKAGRTWPGCPWTSSPPEPASPGPPSTGCSAANNTSSNSSASSRHRPCAAASSTPPLTWSAATAWPSCPWTSWPPK